MWKRVPWISGSGADLYLPVFLSGSHLRLYLPVFGFIYLYLAVWQENL